MLPGSCLKGPNSSGLPMESGQGYSSGVQSRASTLAGISYVSHQYSVGRKGMVPVGRCLGTRGTMSGGCVLL